MLEPAQIEWFAEFEARLYEANTHMNLTRVDREECWLRHFVDSLLVHEFIPRGSKVLDVGCGPGFPSWPLACARPDLEITALDSSGKMIGFLAKSPLPNLTPTLARAEEWARRESFDVVTGRAVAPLGIQLELSAPHCRAGGCVIPMRTLAERSLAQRSEVAELGLELESIQERLLPGTDVGRLFPIYKKTRATPRRYPRTWAEIKRRPLLEPNR